MGLMAFDFSVARETRLLFNRDRVDIRSVRREQHGHSAEISPLLEDHKQFAKAFGAVTMQDIVQGLEPLIQFLRLDAGDSRFQ